MKLQPLIAGMALSAMAFPALAAEYFPDVPSDHDNSRAIMLLQQAGVFSGYPDGTFRPGQSINRAELLKIFVSSIGDSAGVLEAGNCFPDVHEGDWFSSYVCTAVKRGWVSGYPDEYFRPERQVTLVEALKMLTLVRGYDINSRRFPAEGYPREEWFSKYIDAALWKDAVALETIWGREPLDGLDKPLSRMRAAEILYRGMLNEGHVRYVFKNDACDMESAKTVTLRKYDRKYNDDSTVIIDFDIIGILDDESECVISLSANPYAGASRWWNSRTMFLVSSVDHEEILEEAPVKGGKVYLRGGHETAGLGDDVWVLNLDTGNFSPVPLQ